MKIESVLDPAFAAYGQVVTGLEEARAKILAALAGTPQPAAGTDYCPEDPSLQELPAAAEVSEHLFGGMPCQLGWCNGRNTKLNCLEYHRDSEFNLANEDFILLLARRDEIENGRLRHLHHLPHGEGGCERADVVGIVVIFLQSRRNTGPGAAGDLDIAVAFVILEQDVVLGRVGLDLAGLEDEGLKL